jgi:ATP-dependent Clp protease ATP-binding subunit ClpX
MTQREVDCSFCRKSYREVGPLVEGPEGVYICGECVELCLSIIAQEKRRRKHTVSSGHSPPDPTDVRNKLDQLIRGEEEAKGALVSAAACRHEIAGRVLLLGPSRSSKIFLARALACALDLPFVAEDLGGIGKRSEGGEHVLLLLHDLLRGSDFDIEAAQHGVLYVAGAERLDTQENLLRLWQGTIPTTVGGIPLDTRGVLFVCDGTFGNLEDTIVRMGRHVEQPITADLLVAAGARADWVGQLTAIARMHSLDDETLTRIVQAVDFKRIDFPSPASSADRET